MYQVIGYKYYDLPIVIQCTKDEVNLYMDILYDDVNVRSIQVKEV